MIRRSAMSNFEELHRIACESDQNTYVDPITGYQVMTSTTLLKQGKCCGNGCRHCPYQYINVKKINSD